MFGDCSRLCAVAAGNYPLNFKLEVNTVFFCSDAFSPPATGCGTTASSPRQLYDKLHFLQAFARLHWPCRLPLLLPGFLPRFCACGAVGAAAAAAVSTGCEAVGLSGSFSSSSSTHASCTQGISHCHVALA